jgi:hypothetical protein
MGKEGFSAQAGLSVRSGKASTHLDELSMMTNRYLWPSEEEGRGPSTWENLRAGVEWSC